MTAKTASIIGGGLCGPLTALALAEQGISCTIYELRPAASTIGGAINLTPNALRVLDHFGLLAPCLAVACTLTKIEMWSTTSGWHLGNMLFGSASKFGYDAIRISRTDLHQILLDGAAAAGIPIHYSKKLVSIDDASDTTVTATFADDTTATTDIIVGCDGIHSAVRRTYVDPTIQPTYSGLSSAYGFASSAALTTPPHFSRSALNMSPGGSLITTYADASHSRIFMAAVVPLPADEIASTDGWRAKTPAMADETKHALLDRFASAKLPMIEQLTDAVENLCFFPLWTMPCSGKWSRGRVLLVGDAAHAIPPTGTAAGIVFEDAVVLGRVLAKEGEVERAFKRFEEVRREKVEKAWEKSTSRMEGVKKRGPWKHWITELFVVAWLWWVGDSWDDGFGYDAFKVDI